MSGDLPGDLLNSAMAQAERSEDAVRAAALMRIARVQSVVAPDQTRQTFETGLKLATQLGLRNPEWLMGHARLIAAVVAPDLLRDMPSRHRHSFDAEHLARTMLEHGYLERAAAYVLDYREADGFPFGAAGMVLHQLGDETQKLKLMRRAIEAWRESGDEHSPFLWVFHTYWKVLPREEARDVAREIVRLTLERPDFSWQGTYDPDGAVQIDGGRENTFFQLLHVLRRLDPELAEDLMAKHGQLAAAARRFPYGMESVMEEAEARRREAAGTAREGGYVMAGSSRDFPYLQSLMEASRSGEFEAPLACAVERYREDSAPESPNEAPRDGWPSTSEFRSVLYEAGKRLGQDAAGLLERIPDADLRLFAQIELAAALAGLPELQGIQSEYRPARARRRRTAPTARVNPGGTEVVGEVAETSGGDTDEPGIRCPKCNWRPGAEDRWVCKCGHVWNTFETGGVCPGCLFQWKETQCLRCGEMSPHSDWYTHRE